MELTAAILALAVVTYATRLAGFALGDRTPFPAFDRFLADVPVAVFAALVVLGLGLGTPEASPRLLALAAAGLVATRGAPLWATLAVGLLAFALLGLAT